MLFNFSEDFLNGRLLGCEFNFNEDDDVTEMTHNLFKNFNESNNQFDVASFYFTNDGETSNFMFDNATSGLLEVKCFNVFDINVENGLLPMTESAILGSNNSLEALWIDRMDVSYPKLTFSENFLFALGLSKLKYLNLAGFDWNKFQIPQEIFNALETLIADLTLEALPEMPNLKNLYLSPKEETSLSSDVMRKMPNLEYLKIDEDEDLDGKLKALLPGTFEESKFIGYIDLGNTKLASIDLIGLKPSTYVVLPYSITNLPEHIFRPFLESVVRNYLSLRLVSYQFQYSWLLKNYGGIIFGATVLECSCDFKWLCEVPNAIWVIFNAKCNVDGTTLANEMEFICSQC